MLCSLLGAVTVSIALAAQEVPPPKATDFPKPGSDLPGPVLMYNVTGDKKNHFHCLVSEHGLGPVAMVIVRGAEVKEDGLKDLLVKLDNTIDKNPAARVAAFAVLLTSTLKDLARDDDDRAVLATKVEDLGKGLNLKHLRLALALPSAVAAWKLDEKADVTVVLYRDYRTVAVYGLAWDDLKAKEKGELPAKVKEILDQVREKFGATR